MIGRDIDEDDNSAFVPLHRPDRMPHVGGSKLQKCVVQALEARGATSSSDSLGWSFPEPPGVCQQSLETLGW